MKTIFKTIALIGALIGTLISVLSKAVMILLIVVILTPIVYFAWQMNQPLPQPEFKGLTYYQYVDWRNIAENESAVKWDTKHPKHSPPATPLCANSETGLDALISVPQGFSYTIAALFGAKPDPMHSLPTEVNLLNFVPKWWGTSEYLLWYNNLHTHGLWSGFPDVPCVLDDSVKVPTPAELEAMKQAQRQQASAVKPKP